jgi:hypothetical protein
MNRHGSVDVDTKGPPEKGMTLGSGNWPDDGDDCASEQRATCHDSVSRA